MARPNRWQEIEKAYDRPLKDVVLELLNKHGTMKKAGAELGVHESTLFLFCEENGIKRQVRYVATPPSRP